MNRRELHLNINILNAGFYGSAWRHSTSAPTAFLDVNHYVRTAKIAERAAFDAVFLADTPSFADRPDYRPYQALEPTIVLATIGAVTERIGLIATASTTYNDPYNIARRFGTLDIATNGRVGWNAVTTADPSASHNFGYDHALAHDERYARAAEFCEVAKKLWDSWEDDALLGDKTTGRFIDVKRVHAAHHRGQHFNVRGPLNIPRSPQGRPVMVQAGGSDDGRNLAARHAEVIFSVANSREEAQSFASDIRARARHLNRHEPIVFVPGVATVLASTEAEVKRREEELWALLPIELGLGRLANILQVDVAQLPPDEPVPDLALPANGMQTFASAALEVARRDGLTVRQLLRKLGGSTGHRLFVGTPERLADDMEDWFLSGAADGFNLMPDVLPDGLEIFVDHVVPLLRRKGIFRHGYETTTLRGHLGLPIPEHSLMRLTEA